MTKLELFKEYYEKYKIKDIISNNIRYIFVLESPHNDEVNIKHPVAGKSGIDMAKFIGIGNGNISLGKYCKENKDKGISIINVSSAPLQKVTILEKSYTDLINEVDKSIRVGYKNYGNHKDDKINKIEEFILTDFKNRLNELSINEETQIIVCGKFAESYIKKIKVKNVNNDNILCVPHPARNQWNKTFDNLNKLKKINLKFN